MMSMLLRSKRVWCLQLALNLLLLLVFWLWLNLAEARAWQVILSFAIALVIAVVELWLQCATLAYFCRYTETGGNLRLAFRRSRTHLPAFALWLVAGWLVVLVALKWMERAGWLAGGVRRWLAIFLRIHASPHGMFLGVRTALALLAVLVIPIIWLPPAARIADCNILGVVSDCPSAARFQYRGWRWWLAYFVLFHTGIYFPRKLVEWVPGVSGLSRQAWSAGARFAAAYLLLMTSWFVMAAFLGRRLPYQAETVEVPEPVLAGPAPKKARAREEPEET